ncbi:class I SAM-dependent methyltransferase [Methanoplanus limicola]|uniref:Methyltransferase type 11 n=1 Tax=Methanoplanus limicola DSM 2279 TaxID=937775 RepID=H1Z255_9EURY|nr:class I SAM-dependent methyltransferase [Methanoplanus limicola]EHQ36400.1 Methyltransferase type 11 [Methanoplanus limicola DSM 2279]
MTENTDWNLVWKEKYEKNLLSRGKGDCAGIWDCKEKAKEFLDRSNKNPGRVREVVEFLNPDKDSRILDVGSGPGTLAVPLAKMAGHVTAVEPSPGMADVMAGYAAEEGVNNLNIVRKRWEDVVPGTDLMDSYDIVFASHSLGMPDIKESVEKMNAVSSGKVCLLWFAGITAWEQRMVDLWPQLHGREYCCGPKADVLFNLLCSMDIYPHAEPWTFANNFHYPDYDTAFDDLREQYGVSTAEQESVLARYLKSSLAEENGNLLFPGTTTGMKLWWETDRCR